MSSQLNSILNKIETQLTTSTLLKENYIESQNRKEFTFYKEQRYKDYKDYKEQLNKYNTPKESQINNEEIVQMLQSEMEPYIYKIKRELKQYMQGFRSEIEEYRQYKEEINMIKKTISDNKKLNDVTQEENEKTFIEISDKILFLSKKTDSLNNSISNISKNISKIETHQKYLQSQIPEVSSLKTKISNIEIGNQSIYTEIESQLKKEVETQIKILSSDIDSIKISNQEVSTKIAALDININNIHSQMENAENSSGTIMNTQSLYIAINDKVIKSQAEINELSKQTNRKFLSLNNKIAELSAQIINRQINIQSSDRNFPPKFTRLMDEFMKYNNIYEATINKIGTQLLSLQKEMEVFKQKISTMQKDISSYDDNFENIENYFNMINNIIEKNQFMDQNFKMSTDAIKTLSENNNILQKKMESLIEEINEQRSKGFDEIRKEFNAKVDTIKIQNFLSQGRSLDSLSRYSYNNNNIPQEYFQKLSEIEEQINLIKTKYAIKTKTESRFDIDEKRITQIEKTKIPEIYAYIDKQFNDLLEGVSSEKPITLSTRNIPLSAGGNGKERKDESELKEFKEEKTLKNFDKIDYVLYDQGEINNSVSKAVLKGNETNSIIKQSDVFEMKNEGNKRIFKSKENDICINYSKLVNTVKANKNQEYIAINPAQLIASKSEFSNMDFLKNFVVPQKQMENIIEIDYDDSYRDSIKNNDDIENEGFSGIHIGNEQKEFDEEINNLINQGTSEEKQLLNVKESQNEPNLIIDDNDFDDFDI